MGRILRTVAVVIGLQLALGGRSATAQTGGAQGNPPAAAQRAFEEGNSSMQSKKYSAALQSYKVVLHLLPRDPSALWNGAQAAYLAGQFDESVDLWKRLATVQPNSARIHAKLVQVYQALGNVKARDAERAKIFAMCKSGVDLDMAKAKFYCRDQFAAAGRSVFAYEYFELAGEFPTRYKFVVLKKDGDDEEFHISLEADAAADELANRTDAKKQGFWLDGYFNGGHEHRTYGEMVPEPGYDATKKLIIAIIEGKAQPLSRSER